MQTMKSLSMALLLAIIPFSVVTEKALADYSQHPRAQEWVELVHREHDLPRDRLQQIIKQAKRKESILEAIARPAEKTLTWKEYRKIFLQPSRIKQGLKFWDEHKQTLDRAQQETGVPAEFIVAIIGVETRYGKHTGGYRVIDALATLGFDYPPRADFFRGQLTDLMLLEAEAGIRAEDATGSYAGAVGFPQFIPSSYRAYAIDFDDDNVIDLFTNPVDAIGSVANYFKAHRWETGLPVAARARVNGNQFDGLFEKNSPKLSTTLSAASQQGVAPLSCKQSSSAYCFDLPAETRVAPLQFEGEHGTEYWLGTNNFYVITRYNRSRLYALAVFQLATEIKQAYQTEK